MFIFYRFLRVYERSQSCTFLEHCDPQVLLALSLRHGFALDLSVAVLSSRMSYCENLDLAAQVLDLILERHWSMSSCSTTTTRTHERLMVSLGAWATLGSHVEHKHAETDAHICAHVFMQCHMETRAKQCVQRFTKSKEHNTGYCSASLTSTLIFLTASWCFQVLMHSQIIAYHVLLWGSRVSGGFLFPSISLHAAEKHSVRNVPVQRLSNHFRPQLRLQSSHYMLKEQVWGWTLKYEADVDNCCGI